MRRVFPALLLLAALTACAPAPADSPPLPALPLASETVLPPASPLPGETLSPPTPEPTASPLSTLVFPTPLPPTPEPSATPELSPARSSAAIQILSPGPLSRVRSPIRLRGYAIPGDRDMIRVELYGEDGRLIFRKLMTVYRDVFKWAYFTLDVPFETRAAAELARLQISAHDERGNTVSLLAVHLLLLLDGYEEINPPGSLDERCNFLFPSAGSSAAGGILTVAGQFRPFNTQPLVLELVAEDGAILANRWFGVPPEAVGGLLPFNADLLYSLDAPTSARLVARQLDDRIAGHMYLFSQPIFLNP